MADTDKATMVQAFTDDNFEADLLKRDQPVLVDFYADWCGPCRMLAPTIETVAQQLAGKATVGKLNVDENPRTAQAFNISSIPAVLLFKDGQVVETFVGVQPERRYVEAVERELAS